MKGVILPFSSYYVMPSICCACGAPAGNHWLKLKTGRLQYAVRADITLKVPLCASCSKMRNIGIIAMTVGVLAGLVVSGVLLAYTASLWRAIETQWLRIGIPIVLVLVIASICGGISQTLVLKILYPKATRLSTRLANNSVAEMALIKAKDLNLGTGDRMIFFFENDAFVTQFQTSNGGMLTFKP
jgi:MFS family permease